MRDLEYAAVTRRVVERLGELTADDEALVVADPGAVELGRALTRAARAADASATLSVVPRLAGHGAEPPAGVAAAMRAVDVVFVVTEHSLVHTEARREAAAAGTRVAVLRGVTPEMLVEGAMTADFEAVRRTTGLVCDALTAASEARVSCPEGTKAAMSLEGRSALPLDGFFHDYGFSNLPPGLAVCSPVEGTAEGTIVLDHAMDGIGAFDEPVELVLDGGRAVEFRGGSAAATLRDRLDAADANARNLAEFAPGTNPAARLTPNLAECKKRLGVLDVALGDNTSIGGTTASELHIDSIITRPAIELDGREVLRDGEYDEAALQAVADG
ncbi:aminopeptidase [Halorarum halophilum]|uniref:Aminopeptidase n=1 Tax=Halorarum halophilum TaxID=2743090 RepID=A0A7D5K0Y5_9EURY|nr:aminopeptidase [Halobaculum halophilum]QLG27281.1 aminopeptidase [Halobaculum halophilum]